MVGYHQFRVSCCHHLQGEVVHSTTCSRNPEHLDLKNLVGIFGCSLGTSQRRTTQDRKRRTRYSHKYEGLLQSSWTHLTTLSRNFVEVRWRSLFRSTSIGKRCTSYNAPPTSRKRAADRWSLRNLLPQSSIFMVGKAHKSHGARSELNSVFRLEEVDRWNPIRTTAIECRSRPMRFLSFSNREKGEEISKWSTVCSTFSRSVRSASLAKRGASIKRLSPHLH
jgi:hypothetical protein